MLLDGWRAPLVGIAHQAQRHNDGFLDNGGSDYSWLATTAITSVTVASAAGAFVTLSAAIADGVTEFQLSADSVNIQSARQTKFLYQVMNYLPSAAV